VKEMKALFKIVFSIIPLSCYCQQNPNDSLKQALNSTATDSAQFQIMSNLAADYTDNNYDSAVYYAQKAIIVAVKNNRALNEARVLDLKGYNLMHQGKLSESFQCLTQALEIATNTENEKRIWNPDTSVSPQKFRLYTLASINHDLGHLMGMAGETDQQIAHYIETRRIAESISDTNMLGLVNMNLGSVYLDKKKNLDSALQMEKAAELYFMQTKYTKYLGYVYELMGDIYEEKHNNSFARSYFYKGAEAAAIKNNLLAEANNYNDLTDFYLNKEKNKDSALLYAKRTLNISLIVGGSDLGHAYDDLSKAYAVNDNQDSAYKYQGLALAATDSSFNERMKSSTDVQKLSFKEQLRLQELEKEKIETENKIRTWSFLIGIGILLLILFLLYRNSLNRKKANTLLQQQKEKVESTLQELKSTQSQLIQSEKMASLGELTAGIAHEIQNPLNFVNNFSEVNSELIDELQEEAEKGNLNEVKVIANDIKENEQKINHHGKRADAIVKGMLQHSRQSSGKKEPTDINALCDEYLRLSYHGLRAKDKDFNAEIKTDFDKSIGKINIIPQDIGRVLLNIYNNAFYAVNEKKQKSGGSYQPMITVSTKKTNDKIEIKVADNGNGIPQNIVDKIFQPFFTTKPTGQGTGLGLSLSYDIVKAHGGEIKVQTKEGEGSTFIIQLPV
jgi:two-component system NtrC family sensor kinase